MRYVNYIVAIATLAGTLAGCADPYYPRYGYSQDPYYPRYGYSQAYYYPSGYTYYAPNYTYAYSYPPSYAYRSRGDYYRNYNGIHAGPENYP